MESTLAQPANATNTCSHCGGTLTYDFKTNSHKCAYCGSTFKAQQDQNTAHPAEPDAGCIRFKNDLPAFKQVVINFLSGGDKTPVNLLFEADFSPAQQLYLPFYKFGGTYEGYYNTLSRTGKTVAENTPLNGRINVAAYSGKSTVVWENIAEFTKIIDTKQIIPISDVNTTAIKLAESMPATAAWDGYGEPQQATQIYQTLDQADPTHEHRHYLKYHTETAGKFYYPVWRVTYTWQGDPYDIYMDGVGSQLSAGKPEDQRIGPPARKKIYQKYLLIGLGLWFGMLVLRAALAAFVGGVFDIKNSSLNNIVFSEGAGLYWFLRGVIFLGVFPAMMATVFYPKITGKYYKRLDLVRKRNLDLIASGKKSINFRQAG